MSNPIEEALGLYTSAIMSAIINAYWLYKGDASTQIEDVDQEALIIELMTDRDFMGMILEAIQKVGLS